MAEDYRLLTPENVELRYQVAGVGSRLWAACIDYTIIVVGHVVVVVAVPIVIMAATSMDSSMPDEFPRNVIWAFFTLTFGFLTVALIALVTLVIFLGWWGYFILFELLWNGQTPGKRVVGLRAVRAGGQNINFTASLVRNLLRAIDLLFLIGVLVMLIDRSSRRLGDLAAGSLVVHEARTSGLLSSVDIPEVPEARVAALPNPERLTMAHYNLLRDYFARYWELPPAPADELTISLALQFAQMLEVERGAIGDAVAFLAMVAHAFEARHRYHDTSA